MFESIKKYITMKDQTVYYSSSVLFETIFFVPRNFKEVINSFSIIKLSNLLYNNYKGYMLINFNNK